MRKWLTLLLSGILLFALSRVFFSDDFSMIRAALRPADFYLDGQKVNISDRPGYYQNGKDYVPAALEYEGTIYVPLSMVGKHLAKPVGWDPAKEVAWLGKAPASAAATAPAAQPPASQANHAASAEQVSAAASTPQAPQPSAPPAASSLSLFEISLGDSEQDVIKRLGQPVRREPSALGYEWWIYNKSYDRYVQVGIRQGKVVDVYSNAPLAQIGNVSIGTSYSSLTGKHDIKRSVTFTYQGASIQITNQMKERPLTIAGDTPIMFYLDTQNSQKVTALRLIDKLVLLQGGFYETKWTYQGKAPEFDPPPLTIKMRELVDAAHERQLLDLVNIIRYRHKLPLLTWYDPAAKVAKGHSKDMENAGFFSHVSATTGLDPFQRLKQGGVVFKMAGENIAAGFPDAIEAHENWMNSPGHRKNVLEKGFLQLGTGVYADYYTQNFITLLTVP
ncbi:CAP-associated domain-containing protein [Brevibacillus migulae]|uniref:CAP-associated domain-containing protein n=1 Tax=Brevibacillus migulae TaxID=1644114 RepID=UPI00106DEAE4|nr:CAP-associated domain-containing protein [Brevibacillus migulae]